MMKITMRDGDKIQLEINGKTVVLVCEPVENRWGREAGLTVNLPSMSMCRIDEDTSKPSMVHGKKFCVTVGHTFS